MKVRVVKDHFCGTGWRAEPETLYLGGVGAVYVEKLEFVLPETWAGMAVPLDSEQAGGPEEIAACILQDRSPSCGAGRIYDGTFSGTLTAGNGVFVDLLLRHGYRVIPASEFDPSMLEQ